VEHLPSAGEIVIVARSWSNRAGVERVMGFCTGHEVEQFMRACPVFERMLVDSGILLLEYWFPVSDAEQEARFRWEAFSRAKDAMVSYTNIPEAPWCTVEADDKRRARLNTIHHLISKVPDQDMTPAAIKLPPRKPARAVDRPPIIEQFFVANRYLEKPPGVPCRCGPIRVCRSPAASDRPATGSRAPCRPCCHPCRGSRAAAHRC